MSYTQRIQTLTEGVRQIDTQLADTTVSPERRAELLERKSQYESEIRRMNRLQWEENTQRVDLDDRY